MKSGRQRLPKNIELEKSAGIESQRLCRSPRFRNCVELMSQPWTSTSKLALRASWEIARALSPPPHAKSSTRRVVGWNSRAASAIDDHRIAALRLMILICRRPFSAATCSSGSNSGWSINSIVASALANHRGTPGLYALRR